MLVSHLVSVVLCSLCCCVSCQGRCVVSSDVAAMVMSDGDADPSLSAQERCVRNADELKANASSVEGTPIEDARNTNNNNAQKSRKLPVEVRTARRNTKKNYRTALQSSELLISITLSISLCVSLSFFLSLSLSHIHSLFMLPPVCVLYVSSSLVVSTRLPHPFVCLPRRIPSLRRT